MAKFETERFHREFGPKELFERVLFVISRNKELKTHGLHFRERVVTRKIPEEILEKIEKFDIKEWKLMTVEVRKDTGKFVSTAWEYSFQEKRYWIVFGFNNAVQSIVEKDSLGLSSIIQNGVFFEFVQKVNRELMEKEEKC